VLGAELARLHELMKIAEANRVPSPSRP